MQPTADLQQSSGGLARPHQLRALNPVTHQASVPHSLLRYTRLQPLLPLMDDGGQSCSVSGSRYDTCAVAPL